MSSKIDRLIPNTLYEVIAYFSSGSLFILLGFLSIVEDDATSSITTAFFALDVYEQIAMILVLGILTYIYGQLASTLSAPLIADPVGRLIRRMNKRVSSDFRVNFSSILDSYGLSEKIPEGKRNNKWTLMFYLLLNAPNLGNDLMKRYAREKLARINAFNMLLLFILTIFSKLSSLLDLDIFYSLTKFFKVAHPIWFFVFFILVILYCYEYYKRKCWNNDLLIKVLPIAELSKNMQKNQN